MTVRSTAGCSRVAPRLRSVPRPRCNHHPLRREAVRLHVKVGAASKTTLAERGGYTHTAPRQWRYAQVGRFSANDRRAAVTSDGHADFGPEATLRSFPGANDMPPASIQLVAANHVSRTFVAAGHALGVTLARAPVRRTSLSVAVSSSSWHVRTRSVRGPCGSDCRWATHRFRKTCRRTWMSVVQGTRPR